MLEHVIFAMGVGRIVLGLAPFVAPRLSSRLLGFPQDHVNATARLMARFFGVRDIGLGALVFWALHHPAALGFVLVFNALTDFGDLGAIVIPLVRRQGIDRAALASAAFALPAGIGWLTVRMLLA
jgi:uncharacterized protein YjeT (DUF2065 family)